MSEISRARQREREGAAMLDSSGATSMPQPPKKRFTVFDTADNVITIEATNHQIDERGALHIFDVEVRPNLDPKRKAGEDYIHTMKPRELFAKGAWWRVKIDEIS